MDFKTLKGENFFKFLELNSNQHFFAERYWEKRMNDYIFDENLGWFRYNQFNKLVGSGIKYPLTLLNDISSTLEIELKMNFKELDPKTNDFLKYCKTYKQLINKLGDTKYCESIITRLKSYYNKNQFENLIDNNKYLIAFEDQVYDIKLEAFRDIKKEDYILSTTGYYIKHELDIEGNIKMTDKYISNGWMKDELLDLEEIDKFLDSIFDEDVKKYVVDTLSHNLIHNNFEKLWIWVGSGGNGKGVLSTLLNKALGKLFYQADSQFLTTKYKGQSANSTLYNCKGKKFVMVSEPEMGELQTELKFNIEFLKKITGRDDITCRALRENNITYTPTFNLICQTNEKPSLNAIDEAIRRRLVIIPFKYSFIDNPKLSFQKKRDNSLKDKLSTEKYYISFMMYLIKNLSNIYERNDNNISKLENEILSIPEEVKDEIDSYISDYDVVGKFINEKIIITDDKNDYISKTDLYKEFTSYLLEIKNDKVSKDKFYNQLKLKGIIDKVATKNKKTIRCFENIKLIKDDDDESEDDLKMVGAKK